MGKYEKPQIAKTIAAKMFDNAKLTRLRNREIKKKQKELTLMALKRTTLPVIETDFLRTKDTKCNRCNKTNEENYGITFEWQLEPIDILQENDTGLFGLSKYDSMKRMLMKITNGIIVQPAEIKIMKYLQENDFEMPIIYVLKSRDRHLDEMMLNFIFETYSLKSATSIDEMDEILIGKLNKNLILHVDDENQFSKVFRVIKYGEMNVQMIPVSIEYEINHNEPFHVPFLNILPKFFYNNYGRVKINFNEPYTCSELLQWINDDEKTEEYVAEVICGHLLHDISFKRPVFATNIVAYLLLTYFRTIGGTVEDIAMRIDDIRKTTATFIDFAFDGDSIEVAKYGLTKLNDKIIINENLIIRPIEKSSILAILWDYGETLFCHFTLQSILILSAEHIKRIDKSIDYDKLMDLAVDYCDILQYEIPIYKPCMDIKEQLGSAFDVLSRKEMMTKNVITYTETERRAQRIAKYLDNMDESDEDEYSYDEINTENEVIINIEMQKEIDFLKNVTLPIQESYMNVAYCLKRFIGQQLIPAEYFFDLAMNAMIDECLADNCKYWESCSMKWMRNSFKLFLLWEVIGKLDDSDDIFILQVDYDSEEAIHRVARHIEQFSDY